MALYPTAHTGVWKTWWKPVSYRTVPPYSSGNLRMERLTPRVRDKVEIELHLCHEQKKTVMTI
jgi:hypothetical protein